MKLPLTILDIMRAVPHRHPFLMLDRVVELEEGRRIAAYKHVSSGELLGVNPLNGRPELPAEMLVEVVGQAAMVLLNQGAILGREQVPLFVGCSARFDGPVEAGCRVDVEAIVEKRISNAAIVVGRARVGDRSVAQMTLSAGLLSGDELTGAGA